MTVGRAIWPDLLSQAERAQLRRGMPATLDRAPDVLVVGGGILGVTIAAACSRARLGSIVLLERDTLGCGASGGAAGQLLPEAHVGLDPPALVDLARTSLELWRELHKNMPGGVGLVDLSWLGLERGANQFAAGLPPGAKSLTTVEVARLVPGLNVMTTGVIVTGQARVNPLQALARLAATLPGLATGVEVLGVVCNRRRVESVRTIAGDFRPRAVIFATGNPPLLDGLDLRLPWHEVKGHMLVTQPVDVDLPGTVAPLATTIDQRRLMVGGTLDVGDDRRVVRPEVIAAMRAELGHAWPRVAEAEVAYQWACFRPAHSDHLPVVDRLPGLDNAWLTSGHYKTGILLAPATAAALAGWVASGERPAAVASLGIDRFS